MPVEFVSGDLFKDTSLDGLAHGCNCAGAMGKGIATEFRRRFPKMYEEYHRLCKANEFQLGDVFVWTQSSPVVFNLGTQKTWRTKAELSAIERSVGEMIRIAGRTGIGRIGLPRIGAGLGGLEWEEVKALLSNLGAKTSVTLIVYESHVPGAA